MSKVDDKRTLSHISMRDIDRWELLAKVATLYYEEGLTQAQIAEHMNLSRSKVFRLLAEARRAGIVEIRLHHLFRRADHLEKELMRGFSLKEARVLLTASPELQQRFAPVSVLAARYLQEILQPDSILTISWGKTLYDMVNAIRPNPTLRMRVVQAVGSIGSITKGIDGAELARRLAELFGGTYYYVPAPSVVNDPNAARTLLETEQVRQPLALARQADVAVFGIGSLDPQSSSLVVSATQRAILRSQAAIGDMVGRVFDSQGQACSVAFNDCVIGITFNDLRRIPYAVAVAGGLEKAKAILGALRSGVIDVLCTDSIAASEVLRLDVQRT